MSHPMVTEIRRIIARQLNRVDTIATLLPSAPAMLIFIVGGIDLVLTMHALENGWLIELNPVTNAVIQSHGAAGLIAWRLSASTIGAGLLYWALGEHALQAETLPANGHRRSRHVVGAGMTVITAAHLGLLFWWMAWHAV